MEHVLLNLWLVQRKLVQTSPFIFFRSCVAGCLAGRTVTWSSEADLPVPNSRGVGCSLGYLFIQIPLALSFLRNVRIKTQTHCSDGGEHQQTSLSFKIRRKRKPNDTPSNNLRSPRGRERPELLRTKVNSKCQLGTGSWSQQDTVTLPKASCC